MASDEAKRLDCEITALHVEDGTFEYLLSIPSVGPRTASDLVIGVDISR